MSMSSSQIARPARSLLSRVGELSSRLGTKLSDMSESPWDRAHRTQDEDGQPAETPPQKAKRLGYVTHGEFGLKIAYDPDVISDKVIDTIERGAYERFEGRRSRSFVLPGDRVIELGSGLGFLSALIMKSTPVDDYQLVEADPRLPEMMRRTHQLNGVRGPMTINSCVATCNTEMIEAGTVDFHVGKKFCASSLLGANNLIHSVEVPVVSLPEMIAENNSNVLLLDIEGAETDIFNGTPLGGIERILMEIHPRRIGQDGVRAIFRNLDDLGFVYDADASAGAVCGFRMYETSTEADEALATASA